VFARQALRPTLADLLGADSLRVGRKMGPNKLNPADEFGRVQAAHAQRQARAGATANGNSPLDLPVQVEPPIGHPNSGAKVASRRRRAGGGGSGRGHPNCASSDERGVIPDWRREWS